MASYYISLYNFHGQDKQTIHILCAWIWTRLKKHPYLEVLCTGVLISP